MISKDNLSLKGWDLKRMNHVLKNIVLMSIFKGKFNILSYENLF